MQDPDDEVRRLQGQLQKAKDEADAFIESLRLRRQMTPQELEDAKEELAELQADMAFLQRFENVINQRARTWQADHPGEELTDDVFAIIIRNARLQSELDFYKAEIERDKKRD